MSDHAELRKLAEAACDRSEMFIAEFGFHPHRIITLLDERDRLRDERETQVMGALSDWNLAAEKMKADIKAAHASGIREGLERAAKEAERPVIGEDRKSREANDYGKAIAAAIRSMGE